MIKNNHELAKKALDVAKKRKTLYVRGGWGQPLNASNKTRAKNAYAYNRAAARAKKIDAASASTFAFDCVCLVKALLWGWDGNTNAANGGAKYASNGVPDINADAMINVCKDVSGSFNKIEVGEFLWMPGHCGIYIGEGLAVECTPSWSDNVQVTAVGNIGKKAGYNTRTWRKHGKLPYLAYVGTAQTVQKVDPLSGYSDEELAHLVILGEFGNGTARKQTLGTRYDAVQKIVNRMLKG